MLDVSDAVPAATFGDEVRQDHGLAHRSSVPQMVEAPGTMTVRPRRSQQHLLVGFLELANELDAAVANLRGADGAGD